MAKPYSNHIDNRKIAELTVSEFTLLIRNIHIEVASGRPDDLVVQMHAISETMKNLASKISSIEQALQKVSPPEDPEESQYLTVKQAAKMIGVSRQTIQEKKSKLMLEFYGEGRIQRTSVAAVKRYLKKFGKPLSQIKRAEKKRKEEEEKKKKEQDAIRKNGNRGIT